jgi:hypothetical protein
MRLASFTLGLVLLAAAAMSAQQNEIGPAKLVGWMRVVNTLEAEYKTSHNRFADIQELLAFAKDGKQTGSAAAFAKELSPTAIQPWVLRVIPSADGSHYLALIKLPSDMHNEATWCKTEVYSDDSGLISLGQNIQCSAANALGASSKPMK